MLIYKIVCPKCSAVMNSKTGVPSGATIPCPKCQHKFAVAAPEEAEVAADFDVVDDEEEAPRKKLSQAKTSAKADDGEEVASAGFEIVDEEETPSPKTTLAKNRREKEDEQVDRPRKTKGIHEEEEEGYRPRRNRERDEDQNEPNRHKDQPATKRKGDGEKKGKDRSRSGNTSPIDDDEEDRRSSRTRHGSLDDEQSFAEANSAQLRNTVRGIGLLGIALWCQVGAFGTLVTLAIFGQFSTSAGGVRFLIGLPAIANWLIAIGAGCFLVSGLKKRRLFPLTMALLAVSVVHVGLLIYVAYNGNALLQLLVLQIRGATGRYGWEMLPSPFIFSGIHSMLASLSFLLVVWFVLAALLELARFILIELVLKEVSTGANDGSLAKRARLLLVLIAATFGGGAVLALVSLAVSGRGGAVLLLGQMLLVFVAYVTTCVLAAIHAQRVKHVLLAYLPRKARGDAVRWSVLGGAATVAVGAVVLIAVLTAGKGGKEGVVSSPETPRDEQTSRQKIKDDVEEAIYGEEENKFAEQSGISRATLKAWRNRKLSHAWYVRDQSGSFGFHGKEKPTKSTEVLAGFSVFDLRAKLAGLPVPEAPFLLDLGFRKNVNDDDLNGIGVLHTLNVLQIAGTAVTDRSLAEIKALPDLRYLDVGSTGVTDAGLQHLANLKNLAVLKLHDTPVTDDGIRHLVNLKSLAKLELSGTFVTDAGLEDLQQALTNCKITRSYARTGAPVTKKGGSPNPKTGDGPDPKKEVKVEAKLKIIEAAQNLKMDLAVRKVLLSDDGARVAVELSQPNVSDPARTKVQVWNLKGNSSMYYEHTGMMNAFSPDGKKLVVFTTLNQSDLIDVEAKKVTGQIRYSATYVHFLSPDAIVAIRPSANTAKQNRLFVKVFNATDGKEESSTVAGNDDRVSLSAPFNHRGEIAIGVENENLVKIWDVRQKKVVREFEAPDADPNKIPSKGFKWKREMPVSSDGKLLVLGQPRSVEFWDALRGAKMYSVNSPFPARGAFIAPEIYLSQGMFAGSNNPQTMGSSAGDTSNSIMIAYNLARAHIIVGFRGHPKTITAFAVSDNGKVMATGDAEGNLKIWDLGKLP